MYRGFKSRWKIIICALNVEEEDGMVQLHGR